MTKLLSPVESLMLLLELQGIAAPPRERRVRPGGSPRFESRGELCYALDPMPEHVAFTLHVLTKPGWFELRGDMIDIKVSNGRWVYRIVELWPDEEACVGRLVYAEPWDVR